MAYLKRAFTRVHMSDSLGHIVVGLRAQQTGSYAKEGSQALPGTEKKDVGSGPVCTSDAPCD
jgi:hypothetical protein